MTGKEDIVSDGSGIFSIKNGHSEMGSIVGTGCMAASIIGSFAALNDDFCDAAIDALSFFGVAGELAAAKSTGSGSFKMHLYDEVSGLTDEKAGPMINIESVDG
jgi:hydroxyethylthiazole kinase